MLNEKKRESLYLLLVPLYEALALPDWLNEQLSEASRKYVMENDTPPFSRKIASIYGVTYPQAIHSVAAFLTNHLKLARFHTVKKER